MLIPETVHYGREKAVIEQRQRTLNHAWESSPERFVRGQPMHTPLPRAVWINKPDNETAETTH